MEEKRGKKNEGEGIDRLSNLPECLLLHILSFLPTKTCVNTMSLVSRRYRNLWEHLQVLNVDEDFEDINAPELFRYILLFVNTFLARRKSRDIQIMHLAFDFNFVDEFSALYLDAWIRTAVGPQLKELYLGLTSDQHGDTLNLPLNLLSSCPNLFSLTFLLQLLPSSSSAVCLPSLKNLLMCLHCDVDDVDVPSMNAIFSGCPILETLNVNVYSNSLIPLRVPHSLKRLIFEDENLTGTCLEIDAPGLKYLNLLGITFKGNTFGNLHEVDEAYLNVFSLYSESGCASAAVDPLHNLLPALSGVKHLVLDCLDKKWLFDVEFPEFRHLIHLELDLPCFNIDFLYYVLQKCPMLQALKIYKHKDQLPPLYGWAPKPKVVPNCLVSHLTCIRFKGCQGCLDEMKCIKYVLRKGLVLKTMHISSLFQEKWEKSSITQISNMPRGSVSCQLQFD